MGKIWYTPGASVPRLYVKLSAEPNLLIAGTVGSGKSVFENGIIYSLVSRYAPGEIELFLADPKRVELYPWHTLPHCKAYADTAGTIARMIDDLIYITERRFQEMRKQGLFQWDGSEIYLFIDELADLMTTAKKAILPRLQKLLQVGRAAGVHVFALTQSPSRAVIPSSLVVNFTGAVGLRCKSAIESRQIIGAPGAELLPRFGECIVSTSDFSGRYKAPKVSDDEKQMIIAHWAKQNKSWRRFW